MVFKSAVCCISAKYNVLLRIILNLILLLVMIKLVNHYKLIIFLRSQARPVLVYNRCCLRRFSFFFLNFWSSMLTSENFKSIYYSFSEIFHKNFFIYLHHPTKLIPWELYVTKNYGMGMRIYITKFVLIALISQWSIIYLSDTLWFFKKRGMWKEGRMWLKTKEQARNREVLT